MLFISIPSIWLTFRAASSCPFLCSPVLSDKPLFLKTAQTNLNINCLPQTLKLKKNALQFLEGCILLG
jgi:hypothetical protein